MRLRPIASLSLALVALAAVFVPALPAAADSSDVLINEVESNGGSPDDWIELVNAGTVEVDVSGWGLKDDDDTRNFTLPTGTTIPAGGYLAVDLIGTGSFGLGASDIARLYDATNTLVDSYAWTGHAATTYGRCADTTGDFVVTVASTKGAANACVVAPSDAVRVNEVESSDGTPGDWVELTNIASGPVDASGLVIRDSDDTHNYTIPSGTTIEAGGYLVLDESALGFGLGGADSVRVFLADGTTLIDDTSWTSHAATTYGRCPDGVGDFALTTSSTKAATNDCPAPTLPAVRINEVESNGGTPGDWAELFNSGASAVDVSGWIFKDNDDTHVWVIPSGTSIAPGGYFLAEEAAFIFGLGSNDSARLFLADGVTLVDSRSWTGHATTTYGICGTDFVTTTSSTKGAANDCSSPVRINEVESNGDTTDWIELKNNGVTAVDVSGWVLKDNTDNGPYTVPASTTIAAGGYLTVDVGDAFFGLGGSDSVRVFQADGVTSVDSTTWTSHASTTYGRCPDGTGEFATTTASTRNAVNACPGDLATSAWPGGATVAIADDDATFGGDLSGLVFDGGAVWAVNNGDGILYRLVRDGATWGPVPGWESGRVLHYANGGGTVDSEGVTVDGSAGDVFVSSERNNDASGVSRLAVLRYDVTSSAPELTATTEWDLTSLLPAVGANLGLEGIAWVPDSYLLNGGFVDANTSTAYEPADYPGHGDGLFFVGVEATGAVHAFALDQGGSGATLVATFDSGFEIVADLAFDAERGGLWVACDDTCQGRTAIFEVGAAGTFEPVEYFERPAGMDNLNNEGFAIAPQGTCDAGSKVVLWADDGDTGGHSLRAGTIECTEGGAPVPYPDDALTAANQGSVTAPGTANVGQTITVDLGAGYAGDEVDGWIYSTPTHLGSKVVASAGTLQLTLPAGIAPGVHRVVVTAADGQLIGWAAITISASDLAFTGSTGVGVTLGIGGVLLAAGVVFLILRRKRTAG